MGEGSQSATPAASEARKRRKAIIKSQRKESEHNNGNGNTGSDTSDNNSSNGEDSGFAVDPSHKQGRKRKTVTVHCENHDSSNSDKNNKRAQIRYDPDVPMSKEQLAAWRREARRVRNRESAAASRQRIRSRISELEDEVAAWKAKYEAAMKQLSAYQTNNQQSQNSASISDTSGVVAAAELAAGSSPETDGNVHLPASKKGSKEARGRSSQKDWKIGACDIDDSTVRPIVSKKSKNPSLSGHVFKSASQDASADGDAVSGTNPISAKEIEAASKVVQRVVASSSLDFPGTEQLAAAALAKAAEAMTSFHGNSAKLEKMQPDP
ncbi:hypothetical protein ACA910_016777 [Epithemia clementina (nom. ined.)]